MIFQTTQLLLIISICKVNGISFRHDASGFVTTEDTGTQQQSSLYIASQEILPTEVNHATTTGFDFFDFNYGPLSNSIDSLESYISQHDGRILKQYQVFEDHGEGDIYNSDVLNQQRSNLFHTTPKNFPQFFYPTSHIQNQLIYPDSTLRYLNGKSINFEPYPTKSSIKSHLSKNHGPVALGSGALGYIRLPSGAIYLGSGSLGYISHKDHHDTLSSIHERRQSKSLPGPLSFGHRHNE